ncbi:hypothetical protein OUZ56_006024 [Daphnia magna]|uniref:Uncharacterized protein n=1 Tax=Daphnia magna TaxID=35525 RepID=A0ABQ9YUH3_9CRUS|nr:hypothetical protein OUZ56_006024 [Daphnia magna]
MAAVSLGYDGYSQSLSVPMDVRGRQNSCGDSSSSSGDDSSWSDWEAETDGQVHQVRPPVVKKSCPIFCSGRHLLQHRTPLILKKKKRAESSIPRPRKKHKSLPTGPND